MADIPTHLDDLKLSLHRIAFLDEYRSCLPASSRYVLLTIQRIKEEFATGQCSLISTRGETAQAAMQHFCVEVDRTFLSWHDEPWPIDSVVRSAAEKIVSLFHNMLSDMSIEPQITDDLFWFMYFGDQRSVDTNEYLKVLAMETALLTGTSHAYDVGSLEELFGIESVTHATSCNMIRILGPLEHVLPHAIDLCVGRQVPTWFQLNATRSTVEYHFQNTVSRLVGDMRVQGKMFSSVILRAGRDTALTMSIYNMVANTISHVQVSNAGGMFMVNGGCTSYHIREMMAKSIENIITKSGDTGLLRGQLDGVRVEHDGPKRELEEYYGHAMLTMIEPTIDSCDTGDEVTGAEDDSGYELSD